MTKRKAGKITSTKLEQLAIELHAVQTELDSLSKKEKEIIAEISSITAKWQLPIVVKKSEYLNVPQLNKSLRVTTPESSPTIDAQVFLEEIGWELLSQVCKIKSVELDVDRWLEAVKEERANHSNLSNAIKMGNERKRIIAWGPIKSETDGELDG